jgi:hypothetical protein
MSWRVSILSMAVLLLCASTALADDGDGVVVRDPLPGTPEHLIQKVFVAAQFDDFRGFYGDLCHRDTCRLKDVTMKAFQDGPWQKFREHYKKCLVDTDALTYRYDRTSPKKITTRTKKVTFYFDGESMVLKRDEDGAWKVYFLCE